ncbi:hypothetical protein D2V17_07725 [Aurantiacibacter xanthus]|uniref:Uncharacterized protein n=1 Tax=Aurantiacibacter xanthus TaxID=1784712 RepID=A0A3A1P8K0_9SPHN|nr:hypothetical protein [Aurantiacibacter xanthus]RIV88358.1 hypothetical protein D2V17_07725 [Aurantiacibacter xanthus]
MTSLPARIVRRLRERRFPGQIAGILATPPVTARADGLVLFSMIGTRVLLPYLVAAKSLHAQLDAGRFVILDDGTLTADDKALLAHHCDNPEIIPLASVDTGPCPRGGTWERLLTILDLRRDNYVIQFDSDTVTTGAVPEVTRSIAQNRSFTIRGDADAEIRPVAEIARRHAGNPTDHVQAALEARMDELVVPSLADPYYVRGCSGFTGFAREAAGRALAVEFSQGAEALLGRAKWSEWGSEQVTSNFVVANAAAPLLLPYDRYMNFWDEGIPADVRVIHFIGTYRFHRGAYVAACRKVIADLRR